MDAYMAVDVINVVSKLRKQLKRLDKPAQEGDITDEMVEQARNVDTARIIEFTGGKSLAFCHDDRNPSLTYHKKTGRAHCFVCNKSYDAIQILIERDGMSFPAAVRELCQM